MTDKPTEKKSDRRPGIALLLTLASAAGLWLAGRAAWLTVTTFDDKSGEAVNDLVGATWAPETTALALALAAAVAATLPDWYFLPGRFRSGCLCCSHRRYATGYA